MDDFLLKYVLCMARRTAPGSVVNDHQYSLKVLKEEYFPGPKYYYVFRQMSEQGHLFKKICVQPS